MAASRASWSPQGSEELVKLVKERGTGDLQVIANELVKKDASWNYSKDQVHNHIEYLRKEGKLPAAPRGRPPKKRKIEEDQGPFSLLLMCFLRTAAHLTPFHR
jgi:hypothetical protein